MYTINNNVNRYFTNGSNALESIGIYLRLSREDDNLKDQSLSIQNQRSLCRDYAKNQLHNEVKSEYIDDGFSGTTFDKRRGFLNLMQDVSLNKINCIIVKDLSRLGRNYNYVGYLIEEFFPKNHIRLISLADSYDSFVDTDDYLVFKNVFNEFYSKDISRKVKASRSILEKKGAYLNSIPPFGYRKDKKDKHRLVIDEKVKDVVIKIFLEYYNTHSTGKVARMLNEENIKTPYAYFVEEGIIHKNISESICIWDRKKVRKILTNDVYIGNISNGKTRKINHKSHSVVNIPQKEWITVKDVHEPIIEKSLFYDNLKYLEERQFKRRSKNNNNYLFKNKIYCDECNSKMYGWKKSTSSKVIFYVCNQVKRYGKKFCKNGFYINQEKIETQILSELKTVANKMKSDKKISKNIRKKCVDNIKQSIYNLDVEYKQVERLEELHSDARQLVIDYRNGLYNKNFCNVVQDNITKNIQETEEKLNNIKREQESSKLLRRKATEFLTLLNTVSRKKRLDKVFIEKMIDDIRISVDDEKPKIKVKYYFIGTIEKYLS